MTEKVVLDGKELAMSMNGFDERAIRQMFGLSFDNLDGTMPARALYFIHLRRSGVLDGEAFRSCMNISVGEMQDLFSEDPEEMQFVGSLDGDDNEGKA